MEKKHAADCRQFQVSCVYCCVCCSYGHRARLSEQLSKASYEKTATSMDADFEAALDYCKKMQDVEMRKALLCCCRASSVQ